MLALTQDPSLQGYRCQAAEKITQGNKQNNAWLALAQDPRLYANGRYQAATKLAPGPQREQILLALARDPNMGECRVSLAILLAPGPQREQILIPLAQDQSLNIRLNLEATINLSSEEERRKALLALAQDQRKHCFDVKRLTEAVLKLPPDDKRDNILLAMVKNRSWRVEDRKDIAHKISSSQIRTQAFSNIF